MLLDANDFLGKYGMSSFRHSAELVVAIQTGACVVEGSVDMTKGCGELLRIYRIRAKRLWEFISLHAASILTDVNALISSRLCANKYPSPNLFQNPVDLPRHPANFTAPQPKAAGPPATVAGGKNGEIQKFRKS